MSVISNHAGVRSAFDAPGVASYNIVAFDTRAAAVRFCRRISEVLDAGSRAIPSDVVPTVWLAALDGLDGPFLVYACDRSLAAARAEGLVPPVVGRIRHVSLPAARCLVVGERRALDPH